MEASTNNVAGHRAKYDLLNKSLPKEEVGRTFVGGGDAVLTGFFELETIRNFKQLKGSDIVDVGCGIGRLTKYLLEENVGQYLGIDIIPEILQDAIEVAKGHPNFNFAIGENCKIPAPDASFDVICGFSLITHLLEEEIFEYFLEARRVLRSDGVAVFSFVDFENPHHQTLFFRHARHHRHGHGDLLKFVTKSVLRIFAKEAGFSATTFLENGVADVGGNGRSSLIDGRRAPRQTMGQSVCAMFVSGSNSQPSTNSELSWAKRCWSRWRMR